MATNDNSKKIKGKTLIIVENNSVPFDRRVWYEANSLREAGWHVFVVCPEPTDKRIKLDNSSPIYPHEIAGIQIYYFPLNFAEKGWAYLREYIQAFYRIFKLSWKIWRNHGFDIIHICNPPDIFFPIGLFYRFLGAKFIFDHHDLFPEMVLQRFQGIPGELIFNLSRLMEYLTFHSANLIITVNHSFQRVTTKRNKGPLEKTIIVRNGPKIAEFYPLEPHLALKEQHRFMVIFVGIMGEEDGVLEMIEVARYIIQEMKREDILFIFIGDGSARPVAQKEAKRLKLESHVRFTGMIQDDLLLRQYLSTSDICVSPEPNTPMNVLSTFIKIGEYMAMGKAIVAFDLEETRYTAQDAAYYVKPGDYEGFASAIIKLLDDPERRIRMGALGRQRILDSLAWEHQQQYLLKAYHHIIHS